MVTITQTHNQAHPLTQPYVVKHRPCVPFRSVMLRTSLDALALFLSFFVSVTVAGQVSTLVGTTPIDMNYVIGTERHKIFAALAGLVIFVLYSKGHYTNRFPWWSQVQFVASLVLCMVVIDGFTSFALELYFSRLLIVTDWAVAFLFLLGARYAAYVFQRNQTWWQVPTIIAGDAGSVSDVLYALNGDRSTGYTPHTIFLRGPRNDEFNVETLPARFRDIAIYEDNNDFDQYILDNPDNYYIISLESFRGEKREDVIRSLDRAEVRYAIIPSIGGISLYDMEPRYFFGQDVMFLHVKPISSPLGRAMKRAMDIVLSAMALLMFLPIIGIIAAMLKIEGQGGTVFYGGQRLGHNGKLFNCWKFRSMEPDSDHLLEEYLNNNPEMRETWETYHKLPDDPRIKTRTARIIRKASLDEIPQLWNVLKGDMSLVGPRPILPSEETEYGNNIDAYIKVKPGITGLWQVSGRNAVSFQRRIYWDNWYVRNWSLWGDIVIILKTIPVVVSRSDAS
jgi:undecaprenyl-phosphate galactose phosphotransferase